MTKSIKPHWQDCDVLMEGGNALSMDIPLSMLVLYEVQEPHIKGYGQSNSEIPNFKLIISLEICCRMGMDYLQKKHIYAPMGTILLTISKGFWILG